MEGELAGVVLGVISPKSLDELLTVLADIEGPRRLLAGGTDLVAQAKAPGFAPATWVDIWGLDELRRVEVSDERVTLGANVTMARVEASPELKSLARALWDGCSEAGSVQIRNRATLGGNAGNASPAADTVPGLISLGATCHVASKARGFREVPLESLALAPRMTALEPDELITQFSFLRAQGSVGAFERLGQRKAQAISKVSVAATATLEGGVVASIRVALGAVAPTVIRAPETEAFLVGKPLDSSVIAEAAQIVRAEASPIDDIRSTKAYRSRMLAVVLRRVLERLSS